MVHPRTGRPGYPALAEFMTRSSGAAIFRSFKELRLLNLLRLQAELNDLQQQLRDVQDEDAGDISSNRSLYEKDFFEMRRSKSKGGDSFQYDMLESIELKLSEYDRALQQMQKISTFAKPNPRDIEALIDYITDAEMGCAFLRGNEMYTWSKETFDDLLTLAPPSDQQDAFSKLLEGIVLDGYHFVRSFLTGRKCKSRQVRQYSKKHLGILSKTISCMLSALLPTLATFVLFYVPVMVTRICLVLVFTTCFASMMAIFSDASKAEIFMATSTFAAVEVVFIGSTSNIMS